MAVVCISTIALLLGISYWSSRPQYQLLYANLEPDAASAVLDELRTNKISYQLGDGGRSVFVPAEKVYDLRLELAGKGIPIGGADGLELFDRTAMGSTRFMQEINYQRALQTELVRSITQIRGVRGARIHIVPPKESLFIEDQEGARASVILNVDPQQRLKPSQVKAIAHLVAGGVKGMEPNRVAIIDSNGDVLQSGEPEESTPATLSADQLAQQFTLEKELKGRVEAILSRVVGRDNVIARVSAKLNFKREESTAEFFDPDAAAIRSHHRHSKSSTRSTVAAGGVAGTDSNLPGRETPEGRNQQTGDSDNEETINYEITKTVTRTVTPVGELQHVSVAVLVNGTYKQLEGGPEGDTAVEFVPRTPEEIAHFTTLVKRAVGYSADRGDQVEVVSLPFASEEIAVTPEVPDWHQWMPAMVAAGRFVPVAIFLLLFFLLFVRPVMRQVGVAQAQRQKELALAEETQRLGLEPSEDPLALTDSAGVSAASSQPSDEERVTKLIKEEPSQGVQVMRSWLREVEEGA